MQNTTIRMTGVGCFAGGVTLARVLRRMMAAYSPGGASSAGGGRQAPSPALRALQRLANGSMGFGGQEDSVPSDEDIAGFFLNFENRQLHLSVFTRGRQRRCLKYTTSLEELTHLRPGRLI
jgi:hypothetical protein